MTTGADLHRALFALVQGISTHLGAYDGTVPADPTLPYAVAWSSAGSDLTTEAAVDELPTGLDWSCQVTVAHTSQVACLDAAATVRAALVGVRLVPGATRLREQGLARTAAFDQAAGRWFIPIPLHCQTP